MPNQCYGNLTVYTDDDNLMKKIQETLSGHEGYYEKMDWPQNGLEQDLRPDSNILR